MNNNAKYKKEYRKNNQDKIKKQMDAYRDKNKEILKQKQLVYRANNKEKIAESKRQYYLNNKDKCIRQVADRIKERYKKDPLFKLSCIIRRNITGSFKRNGQKKNCKTLSVIGCSFLEFREHLESKFEPWMNWDNYGLYNGKPNYGWDLDHIIPLSKAISKDDVIKLNHYTNLQPLCSYINRNVKRGL